MMILLCNKPSYNKSCTTIFSRMCVYYCNKCSYHEDSNPKYITIYFALSFSYVTLHFVVPE